MNQHIDTGPNDFGQDDMLLRRLFAELVQPLDGAAFEQQLALRVQHARRLQLVVWWMALLMMSTLLAIPLIDASMWLGPWMDNALLKFSELLITPAGWLCSLLIAGWVLMKVRVFRRS